MSNFVVPALILDTIDNSRSHQVQLEGETYESVTKAKLVNPQFSKNY